MQQKVILTARINGQTHRDLRVIAEREDRTLSYLVRKAVEQYVQVESPKTTAGRGDRNGCRE